MDLGKEPVKTYESRLDLMRDRLTGRRPVNPSRIDFPDSPQPRPLLKLVGAKASGK
jgi:hypothetical protein